MVKLHLFYAIVEIENESKVYKIFNSNNVNFVTKYNGYGSAPKTILENYGIIDNSKAVMIGVVREDKIENIIDQFNKKIKIDQAHKGIAFTIPIESMIGNVSYKFLSNDFGGEIDGK